VLRSSLAVLVAWFGRGLAGGRSRVMDALHGVRTWSRAAAALASAASCAAARSSRACISWSCAANHTAWRVKAVPNTHNCASRRAAGVRCDGHGLSPAPAYRIGGQVVHGQRVCDSVEVRHGQNLQVTRVPVTHIFKPRHDPRLAKARSLVVPPASRCPHPPAPRTHLVSSAALARVRVQAGAQDLRAASAFRSEPSAR
jgi:hypothetical protein